VVAQGAVAACRELGVRVILVGPKAVVSEEVRRAGGESLAIEIVDAPDAVGMAEKVSRATLKKRS
jgi:fatty acid/phospholipid biosynthesis enzyme